MGRIAAPYGVHGWVRVQSFTGKPDGLAAYPRWWLGHEPAYKEYAVAEWRVHGGALVARLEGAMDRTFAESLWGLDIAVPREQLPPTAENEFYWADLIGLEVVNLAGERLGQVVDMIETGANDVMVVQGMERQHLIPYLQDVILQVTLKEKRVVVDWELDY